MFRKWIYWTLCIFFGLGLGYMSMFIVFITWIVDIKTNFFDEEMLITFVSFFTIVVIVVFFWLWKKFIKDLVAMRIGYVITGIFFVSYWFYAIRL